MRERGIIPTIYEFAENIQLNAHPHAESRRKAIFITAKLLTQRQIISDEFAEFAKTPVESSLRKSPLPPDYRLAAQFRSPHMYVKDGDSIVKLTEEERKKRKESKPEDRIFFYEKFVRGDTVSQNGELGKTWYIQVTDTQSTRYIPVETVREIVGPEEVTRRHKATLQQESEKGSQFS